MREVVVTGLGAVSPLGPSFGATWRGVRDGASGAGPVTRFDPAEYRLRSTIACEVEETFEGHEAVGRGMGRFARFAAVAAAEALADAALDPDGGEWNPDRAGVAVASGLGGVPEFEAGAEQTAARGRPSPRLPVKHLPGLAAGHVGIAVDARGPTRAPATACAAGADAIGRAADDIRLGRADVVIAGGAEAATTPTVMGGFDAMRALSTRNDDPEGASRPFDADRDGFVLGEGAGVLVLESRAHADARGADARAEVAGVGATGDAAHPTRPRDDARGLGRAMAAAIDDAGVDTGAVDLVGAHAAGTPRGDEHEAQALREAFDGRVPPVTAPKGAVGHALGAAGAIEAALAVRSIEAGVVLPTANHETPDCDLPVVTAAAERDVRVALTNSAGFGGANASLLLRGCGP